MEFNNDHPNTLGDCGTYGIEPDHSSSFFYFVSNIEESLDDHVETLIIEVVADDEDIKSESELDITTELSHIKDELGIKPELKLPDTKELLEDVFLEDNTIIEVVADDEDIKSESELSITELSHIKEELDSKPESKLPYTKQILEDDFFEDNIEPKLSFNKCEVETECSQEEQAKSEFGHNEALQSQIDHPTAWKDDPDYHPPKLIESNSDGESTHKMKHSPLTKRFLCSICKNSYSSKFHLTRHQNHKHHMNMHIKQPFLCHICGNRFTRLKNLRKHIVNLHVEERFETESKEYRCYHCEKVYRKRKQLVRHLKVHIEKRQCQCTVCPASFALQQTLMWHQVIHSEHKYECPVCKDSFESRQRLFKHRAQFHSRRKYFGAQVPQSSGENSGRWAKNGRPFLCEICGMLLSSANLFRKHLTLHEKRLLCEVCGKRYCRQSPFTHHSVSHTRLAQYQCETCGKRFVRKIVFERHKMNHATEPGSFLCYVCGKSFLIKEKLRSHMRAHRKKIFHCSLCGAGYYGAKSYNEHMKRHKTRPFKCASCPLNFAQEKLLEIHMKTHEDKAEVHLLTNSPAERITTSSMINNKSRPLRCRFCPKTFPFKSWLTGHEKFHTQVKSHKCPFCSKILKTHLERHMKTHSEERPFKCSVCGKGFRIQDQVYSHMARHAVDPPFACTVCSKGFFTRRALALHKIVHVGDCKCKVCDRDFSQVGLLEEHMRTHTGEKPFQCELCKKTFRIKAYLTRHQKRNPGKKAFTCFVCQSRFCLNQELRSHMTVHVGSTCAVCGVVYRSTYELKSHPPTHTGNTPFECLICKIYFSSRYTRNRHLALHKG